MCTSSEEIVWELQGLKQRLEKSQSAVAKRQLFRQCAIIPGMNLHDFHPISSSWPMTYGKLIVYRIGNYVFFSSVVEGKTQGLALARQIRCD